MGGNVGFIVKKEDGEQIGMSRWTNVMPYHFRNIDLYLGNTKEWYEEFAAEWLKMKDDYERNKATGDYELNMTPVYFPHSTKTPAEYGIIAVDFQAKKIYSSQDYCSMGGLSFYHVWSRYEDNEENIELLEKYFTHDMLKEIEYFKREQREVVKLDISNLKFEDIIQLLEEASNNKVTQFTHPLFKDINKDDLDIYSTKFLIHSDWTFVIYHDRCMGVMKIKKELDKDGFNFTNEENQKWKDYVSWYWEDSDEEYLIDNKDYEDFKTLYQEVFHEPFMMKPSEENN